MSAAAPSWGSVRLSTSAAYLGFELGPGRATKSWDSALGKYSQRASSWGKVGCGLQLTMLAYSTYIFSTLLFIAQLDSPPDEWRLVEYRAATRLFPGPRCWASVGALRSLRHLGFQGGLMDLEVYSLAAKFRVSTFENSRHGGLNVRARARALRVAAEESPYIGRRALFPQWTSSAFLLQLDAAINVFERRGLTSA